ncbi:uncharacterized protein LOC111018564 isoform X3 [Momordica charantia]|nr:uncharacterized protein LOC111018564 isoform X3 [Momordica charantia]XP_022150392.1 uncharacterized protein LOC111018564 isoform X3 [Momordica charantia]XP_022150393.1 uncharacterized protein LOC111018564 isoform X3 [Momordica charantia]
MASPIHNATTAYVVNNSNFPSFTAVILHDDHVVDVPFAAIVENSNVPSAVIENSVVPSAVDIKTSVVPSVVMPVDPWIQQSISVIPSTSVRRSQRDSRPPSYLKDYHCNLLASAALPPFQSRYPLQKVVPFSCWRDSMHSELQTMEANHTWSVVPLPSGHHSIGCKWMYKIKYHSDGTIDRYKARLVAQGYTQQKGLDYIETFSPFAKLVSVKVLLTIVVSLNWPLV